MAVVWMVKKSRGISIQPAEFSINGIIHIMKYLPVIFG